MRLDRSRIFNLAITFALALGPVACREASSQPGGSASKSKSIPAHFTDVTNSAGINHRHFKPVLDHKLDNIMSWMASVGAAACAADYDGDGRIDLFVTNSAKGKPNYLYHNTGDGTFEEVAERAGLADFNNDDGTCMDCAWGDFDNDGDPDLYVVRWGRDLLFRNDGGGHFTNVTDQLFINEKGKPGTPWANGNAVIWFDYDGDGRLDLYIGNYFKPVDLWNLPDTRVMHDSFEHARNAGPNFLYQQLPDGTFRDVAPKLGVDDRGWTLAVGSADVDNNGWPDLFVANDFGPDKLYLNNGDGTFRDVSGTAIVPDTRKGMNAEFGDFDNDGWLDLYVANITTAEYLQEGNMLWHNEGQVEAGGGVLFADVALETGTYDGGWGWGAKFLDMDNDGDLDLLAVNGFISAGEGSYWKDLANWTVTGQDVTDSRNWPTIGDRSFSGYEPSRLWRNEGTGRFTEVAQQAGMIDKRDGRGLVVFDYDNDGDLDLFIANQDQPPNLYRNDTSGRGHWLMVDLVGDPALGCNRDAIGARVTVVTDHGTQIREKDGGNGYAGQSDRRLHFGLGDSTSVRLIEIRWPGGDRAQYLENVPADQLLRVREESSDLAVVRLKREAPTRWQKPQAPKAPPSVAPEEQDAYLAKIEDRIRIDASDMQALCRYRARCVEFGRHDRAINFLKGLSQSDAANRVLKINHASAYIDKIPTCGGLAAIVSKGTLARQGLDVMDDVVRDNSDWWLAWYCRGMNHLHWPAALGHCPNAVTDFKKCLQLQAADEAKPNPKPWLARSHLALGDSYAKDKDCANARDAWRAGLKVFPSDADLSARLAIPSDDDLIDAVRELRGLEKPLDTDLTFADP